MKRILSLILVLVVLLSLTACAKTPSLTDFMNYPTDAESLDECESFLKSCGYKIEDITDKGIFFTDGYWTGTAIIGAISLHHISFDISDADFDKEVSNAQSILQELCGQPSYPSSFGIYSPFKSIDEIYYYNTKLITFNVYYDVHSINIMLT